MKSRHVFILFSLLAILGCGNEKSSGSAQEKIKTRSDVESNIDTFVSALSSRGHVFKDAAIPRKIYELLAPVIETQIGAGRNLEEYVKREHGDLHKQMKDINVSDETANTVLGALSGDTSAFRNKMNTQRDLSDTLQDAADVLSKSENVSDYEAKRVLLPAIQKAWPKVRARLKPLPKLSPISYKPELPRDDPEYSLLVHNDSFYWDEKYTQLLRREPDQLPNGAIIPLIRLIAKPIPQGDLRDGAETPHAALLKFGALVCDPVTSFLLNPEHFGMSSGFGEAPTRELALLASCPESKRKEIIRASLESGWTSVGRYVPANEEWADSLYDQFDDSPYGKPDRCEECRVPTPDEQKLLDDQFSKFKMLFDEKAAQGGKINYYGLMMDLEKQFPFESKKLTLAFSKKIHEYHDQHVKSLASH